MIKQLKKYDVQTTPFTATKSWELRNTDPQNLVIVESGSESPAGEDTPVALEFVEYDTDVAYGILSTACNIALEQQNDDPVVFEEGISGSGLFYPTDPQNINGSYKRLIYHQILRAFYNNYRNPLKIFGIENIDFQTSGMYRYLNEQFKAFTLPTEKFGEKILEGSVTFVDNAFDDTYEVVDDYKGNLYAQPNLFSRVQEVRTFGNKIVTTGTSSYICPSPVTGSPVGTIQLTASLLGSVTGSLTWTDVFDNELGFYVWRSEDSGSTWSYIGSTGPNVTGSLDATLETGSYYSYRVTAYNVLGTSSYSNTASIATAVSDPILYFPDGTTYLLGPYDLFEEYTSGSVLSGSTGGFGWESGWEVRTAGSPDMALILAIDYMSSYSSGSTVSGSGIAGEGWAGGYE